MSTRSLVLLALMALGLATRAPAQIYSRTEIEAWQKAGYTLAAGWGFEPVGVTGSFFRLQQNAFPDPLPDLIDSGLRWRIMQGDFSEGAFHGYYRYGIDRILTGQTAEHSCYGPLYGAKLDVPFGSYNGDQLIGIRAALDTRGGGLSEYHQALGGTASGWSFAPGASLHKTVNTFDPYVRWNGREYEVQCKAVVRYTYLARGTDISFQTKGVEQACEYTINNSQDEGLCLRDIDYYAPHCTQGPTEMWSTDGQVSLELSGTPIVRFPTGEVEVFGPEATVPRGASPADQHPGFFLWNTPRVSAIRWTMSTQKRIDRNGNTTTFLYDPSGIAVVDPQGRTTRYLADEQGRLGAIEAPGFGGTPLRWTLTWTPHVWNPRALFPDIVCKAQDPGGFPGPVPCADQSPYDALTAITEPDGRQYTFSYDFPATYRFGAQGGWGNLTRVTTPEGAAIEYHYGDDTTIAHTPPGFLPNTCPAFQPSLAFPNPMNALFKRRITGITTHPDGIGAGKPAYVSTVDHESVETLSGGPCRHIQWIRTQAADGHYSRTAVCNDGANDAYYGSLHGQLFAQETYDAAGAMIEATYHGNTGRLGVDTGTSPGTLFVDFERGSVRGGRLFDVRPNRVVQFLDGLWWQELLQYESSDFIPTSTPFVFRTLGNVTQRTVHDATGLVKKEESTYFHPGPYLARNLLRLPGTTKVGDDATTFVQTEFTYDECCVVGSGAPNLDPTYTTVERGNATTIARYETPSNPGSRIATRTTYFDTGDVKEIVDGRLQLTSTSPTFGLCSGNPQLTTTVTNAKSQSATTVSDCYRGLPLTVTDLNGQVTTKTYDRLGRTLTLTLPGDDSPSSWQEYCVFGSADNNCATPVSSRAEQRTVLHEKDGTPGGLYSKTFTDGMGRSVQTRTEALDDSGTAVEVVTTTEYDQMGRVSRVWGPRFEGPSNSLTPVGGPLTTTTYDALGRVTTLTAPGNLTTTTTYEPYPPAHQVSFVTDPKGNREGIYRDVLGRTIWHDRLWNEAPGGPRWLTTTFQYDAADRLLHRWDPGNNQISFTYDGLGRKKSMRDPDMGGFAGKDWQFAYDGNGNLTSQTDPKGQTIRMCYDALDRITVKDLPPNFAGCDRSSGGCEDETSYYDGEVAPPPPSCPPSCTFMLSPASASVGNAASTGSVGVIAGPGCAWTAGSNAGWLAVSSGGSGSGEGSVGYTVAANPGAPRSGALTIAGQTFTLSQAGGCSYTITPTSGSFGSEGGSGGLVVNASDASCDWTATANASWLTITSGSSGSGNGTVGYSVATNVGCVRTGTLTIASQTFTVNQADVCNGSGSCNPPPYCWPDLDGDGFGAGTPILSCTGCPAGYVPNSGDCYDNNANARPGQTGCFNTNRGDGSYDYNCSSDSTVCSGPGSYLTSCGGNCFSGCSSATATVTSSQCGQMVPVGCGAVGCPYGSCDVRSYAPVGCQ